MAREMKDSGIGWVGKIPDEWVTLRIKYLANDEIDSFQDGDWIESPYITDTGIRYLTTGNVGDGIFKRQGNGFISEDTFVELNCKYAYPNDLVISRLNAPYGRACVLPADEDKYVLAVDIVILRTNHCKRFLCYLMQCAGYQDTVQDGAKGTTMKRISRTNLGNIVLPIAPIEQQRQIADFLDAECVRIDAVIEQTRASIEEYKKLKQSVITQAVTKGIRPNRPMKDSKIKWFCDIPEEWVVSRVGHHYDIILGKMLCSVQPSDDYTLERYFCAANVHFDGISNVNTLKEMWFSTQEKQLYQVRNGDLLVVEGGAGAGGSAIVTGFTGTAFIQNSIMIVRGKQHNDNRYLRYLLEYLVKQGYVEVACNKATIPHFTKDKLATVPYPVVEADEQVEIADYLDNKCSEIDRLVASKEQFISELEVYKKSLIYEYVTGKKEVPA